MFRSLAPANLSIARFAPSVRAFAFVALVALAAAAPACSGERADAERGRLLFARAGCAACHGIDGRGSGPAAGGAVRPADLTDPKAFRYGRDRDQIVAVIENGRASERGAMPPHRYLEAGELSDLAVYVLSLAAGTPGGPTEESR